MKAKKSMKKKSILTSPHHTMAKSMKKATMKAMKSMKAKKSMKKKSMKAGMKKKKAMRVSKIARGRLARVLVFKGSKEKTVGGNKKSDLPKNKHGRVVSKKASALGSKNKFMRAVMLARKALGIKGFQAVGGKTAKGQALLKKTRSLYKK